VITTLIFFDNDVIKHEENNGGMGGLESVGAG
jgi:hypothetical protein